MQHLARDWITTWIIVEIDDIAATISAPILA
jgi:hypothetical protein